MIRRRFKWWDCGQKVELGATARGRASSAVCIRIAVTRNATDTLRLIERSLRDERISDEEWTAGIRDFEEFLVENPNASCDPRRPSRPARKPFIEDIFLAPDGTLWVEVIRSAGNRLEVFDPEGRLLGSLPAPSRKEGSVPAFGAGHLVTVRRDSLGPGPRGRLEDRAGGARDTPVPLLLALGRRGETRRR